MFDIIIPRSRLRHVIELNTPKLRTKMRYRFTFPSNENRKLVGHPNIFTLSSHES